MTHQKGIIIIKFLSLTFSVNFERANKNKPTTHSDEESDDDV